MGDQTITVSGAKNPIKGWADKKPEGERQADDRQRSLAGAHGQDREADSRENEVFHESYDEPWVRPQSLPDISARAGMVQRWIRVGMHGGADPTNNWSRKYREGWRPRKAESVPDSTAVPSLQTGQFTGCIGVEGMILCEMPATRHRQRQEFFRKRNQDMTNAVDENVAAVNSTAGRGFGRIVQENDTKVGRLREVKVAENES